MRTRKSWPVFMAQCVLLVVLFSGLWWWVSPRYGVGIASGKPCLPGRFYVIARQARYFEHGNLVVFRTDDRTRPYYQPGTEFIKLVRGIPGDRVEIDRTGQVRITGKDYVFQTALEPEVVNLLKRQPGDFARDYQIPAGSYFVMGTLPDSYDSRYWGLVKPNQIAGKAFTAATVFGGLGR